MHTTNDTTNFQTPRDKDSQRNLENVSAGLGLASSESSVFGDESDKVSNTNCERRNSARRQDASSEYGDSGKIFRQLKELHQAHLAYIDKDKEVLQAQLTEKTIYRDEVVKRIADLEEQMLEILREEPQ